MDIDLSWAVRLFIGAGLVFALLSALPMYWAWEDSASSQIQFREFFVSIGFVFAFQALNAIFTGVSEYKAEKRMEELRSLVH